jgi:DNA ligase D-like protein (predicted ligase)
MDLFENRKIKPMLLKKVSKPFDSDDFIFELKLDGTRCLAYLDEDGTILINRRFRNITNIFPELQNLHKQVKNKCILDGEIVCIDERGRPSFSILQTRGLSINPFKIALNSRQNPAIFVAFDILYFGNKEITNLNLLKRKEILENIVIENEFINLMRYIDKNGIDFFQKVQEKNLEGIIAKLKDSSYQIGKRSGDWIKIKNLIDEDFVICGFIFDDDKRVHDLVLGQYKDKELVFSDYIYLERKKYEENFILKFAKNNTLNYPLFDELKNKNIVWIKPELVCTVSYMLRTKYGNMRQPFFKGIRNDISPFEVKIDQ